MDSETRRALLLDLVAEARTNAEDDLAFAQRIAADCAALLDFRMESASAEAIREAFNLLTES